METIPNRFSRIAPAIADGWALAIGSIRVAIVACALAGYSVASAGDTKPLSNSDVIKMVKAGLGDENVIAAVGMSPNTFDTSPDALIELKKQGVSQGVIGAVVKAKGLSNPGVAQAAQSSNPAASIMQTYLIEENGGKQLLKFSQESTYYESGGFFHKDAIDRFEGLHAALQISNKMPVFEFQGPSQMANVKDLIRLFAPREHDGNREFPVVSSGLFVDRALKKYLVPISVEQVPGAPRAFNGMYTTFQVKPASPLPPGEYVLNVLGRYYEFGVSG